jgi:ERCC4-type nuclease
MIIKIDCREKELYDECIKQQLINDVFSNATIKNSKITLMSENLPLGDIIIYDDLGIEKVIIERKTLADLAASIRDGRYKEQGFRLQQCSLHNHAIFYLVEGDLRYYKPFKSHAIDKKALLSSMVSITYFKGFSLHRTLNVAETAEWILQFALKISKDCSMLFFYERNKLNENKIKEEIINNNLPEQEPEQDHEHEHEQEPEQDHEPEPEQDNYAKVMKRIKKNNINKENIGEIMLSQIPGVSINSAIAIMRTYTTIDNLIIHLKQDKTTLNGIKIKEEKSGKERKINKTCIKNIYDFLINFTC